MRFCRLWNFCVKITCTCKDGTKMKIHFEILLPLKNLPSKYHAIIISLLNFFFPFFKDLVLRLWQLRAFTFPNLENVNSTCTPLAELWREYFAVWIIFWRDFTSHFSFTYCPVHHDMFLLECTCLDLDF